MTEKGQFVRSQAKVLASCLKERRRFLQAVAGPRQVGKTTLVRQVLAGLEAPSIYASADEPAPGTDRVRTLLKGEVPSPADPLPGYVFHTRCPPPPNPAAKPRSPPCATSETAAPPRAIWPGEVGEPETVAKECNSSIHWSVYLCCSIIGQAMGQVPWHPSEEGRIHFHSIQFPIVTVIEHIC